MTHHPVVTSSLCIILKIDKFGDFSCDIDYKIRTDVFGDVIPLFINQCDPRSLWRTSVRQHRSAAQASEALVYIQTLIEF